MSNLGLSSGKNVNLSKGIIFSFLAIFFIFYGVFLTNFIDIYQKSNPSALLPIYITYLPFVCYISAVFLGLGLIIFIRKITVQKSREIQSRKKVKIGSIYKEALFLVIFIFAFVPTFLIAVNFATVTLLKYLLFIPFGCLKIQLDFLVWQ